MHNTSDKVDALIMPEKERQTIQKLTELLTTKAGLVLDTSSVGP